MDSRWSDFFDLNGCMIDGAVGSCSLGMGAVNSGAAVLTDPYATPELWWSQSSYDRGIGGFMRFHAYADGYVGYVPMNATYLGDGYWVVDRRSDKKSSNHASPRNTSQPERAVFDMQKLKDCVASLWKATHAALENASFNRQSGGSARIAFESPINIELFPIMTRANITTNIPMLIQKGQLRSAERRTVVRP